MNDRKSCTMKNGTLYEIEYDWDMNVAYVYDMNNKSLGSFTFSAIEEDEYPNYRYLKITNMDLSIRGQGIGQSIIEYVKECEDCPISAGEDYGYEVSDGSHLTGQGVGFIARMRKIGLVTPSNIY